MVKMGELCRLEDAKKRNANMTAALITIYHPSDEVRRNVRCIAEQVDAVYLCDNGPVSNHTLFAGLTDNIRYIFFGANLGISCAFNRILKDPDIAWQEEDYIFFFDQDSLIAPQHIREMLTEFACLKQAGLNVGCLGPAFFNTSSGHIERSKAASQLTDHTYSVSWIITSSMLCTYGTLRQIGFWNECLFLDMADWDLCWRMASAGKLCCQTEKVVLQHSIGSCEKKIGPLHLRVGHPYREYYQIRDCLYLFSQAYTPMKYRLRFIAMILIRSPLHLLFLESRKERLYYISRGFSDFFRGKKGSLEHNYHKETISEIQN